MILYMSGPISGWMDLYPMAREQVLHPNPFYAHLIPRACLEAQKIVTRPLGQKKKAPLGALSA
jgi:hypothetical protein